MINDIEAKAQNIGSKALLSFYKTDFMMNEEKIIHALGRNWDIDIGFFYNLRYRNLNFEDGEKFLEYLRKLDFSHTTYIHKDIVSYLWSVPLFMEWQEHSLKKKYDDQTINKYNSLTNRIREEIERILGLPPAV